MQRKFEVTIPFATGPYYTGYALANSKQSAISLVWQDAIKNGWKGKPGRATVLEVQ